MIEYTLCGQTTLHVWDLTFYKEGCGNSDCSGIDKLFLWF
jgi:hypothetical protein